MQIEQHQSAVNTTGLHTTQFQMKSNAHAFKILSSSLYENKPKAVLRETSANALDAHIAAGCADVPIRITLPDDLAPNLIVEDFGVGMTMAEVKDLYSTYFSSNKTGTNDLIGGFGLGSKSPFSITETFTVTSVKDGELSTVVAYIDSGVPNLTELRHEYGVDQPNGTKLDIPISDTLIINSLIEEAASLFMYWEVKPDIVGFSGFHSTDYALNEEGIYTKLISVDWRGKSHIDDRAIYGSVIVGNFVYQIPDTLLDDMKSYYNLNNYISGLKELTGRNSVMAFLPVAEIGALELAPSRERIEATKENAQYLTELFKTIIQDLTKDLDGNLLKLFEFFSSTLDPDHNTLNLPAFEIDNYISSIHDAGIDVNKAKVALQLLVKESPLLSDNVGEFTYKLLNTFQVNEDVNYSYRTSISLNNICSYNKYLSANGKEPVGGITLPDVTTFLDVSNHEQHSIYPLRAINSDVVKSITLRNTKVYRERCFSGYFSMLHISTSPVYYFKTETMSNKLKVAVNRSIVDGNSNVTYAANDSFDILGRNYIEFNSLASPEFTEIFEQFVQYNPNSFKEVTVEMLEDFSADYMNIKRTVGAKDNNKIIGKVVNTQNVEFFLKNTYITVSNFYDNLDSIPEETLLYVYSKRNVSHSTKSAIVDLIKYTNLPVMSICLDSFQETKTKRLQKVKDRFKYVIVGDKDFSVGISKLIKDYHKNYVEAFAVLASLYINNWEHSRQPDLFRDFQSIPASLLPNEMYFYMADRAHYYKILNIKNYCTHRVFLQILDIVKNSGLRDLRDLLLRGSQYLHYDYHTLKVPDRYLLKAVKPDIRPSITKEISWIGKHILEINSFAKQGMSCYQDMVDRHTKQFKRNVFIVKQKILRG